MSKTKICIIGGGIAGLSAGIYALDNGFDVEIYEKHFIPGGQCTGWTRKGTYIDGCAHWVVGTSPKSEFNPMWKHIGAFDDDTKIYETEYFCKYDINGELVTFYSDLERLYEELVRVAPEDEKMIKKFIRAAGAYQFIRVPSKKPVDKMNIFELIPYGLSMLPVVPYLLKYKHMQISEFRKKFKSPIISEILYRHIGENYNVHSLLYIMKVMHMKDAGVPEGGSKKMALSIADNFVKRGGKLFLNKGVDHVLIEDDVAKGIVLENGEEIKADYVISACDGYHTLHSLLQNKYKDKYLDSRFEDREFNPLNGCLLLSYKVKKNISSLPKMINFTPKNEIHIGENKIEDISLRNYSFDSTLNDDCTTITVLINNNLKDNTYDYLKALSKEEYKTFKKDLGEKVRQEIISYYPISNEEIELLDVATHLTYERYCNAYRGSYMSFITSYKSKGIIRQDGNIKGLKNFVLSSQWIMPPGGLPVALFSGKHAIYRICKQEKRRFINLENYSYFSLRKLKRYQYKMAKIK